MFLDLNKPAFVPLSDPLNQTVFAEDGTSVTYVMVDGRMIYDRGGFLTIDYPKLVAAVRAAAEELAERTRGMRELAIRLEPIVRQYCEGLARQPLADGHPCAQRGLE